MRTLALVVAYDGTDFHGWQRQPGLRTAQGELERGLSRLLGEDVQVTGAGRTDKGVHARGQVATFETSSALPVRAFAPALNRALPPDLRVRSAEEREAGFDARRSATARRYAYRLLREEDVLLHRFAVRPRYAWKPDAWQRATAVLEGRHDFTSFESAGSPRDNRSCRVWRAGWSTWEGGVQLDLTADHFLYHMVRNIVGTALKAGTTADAAAAMRFALTARRRTAAGPCAPPQGLTLEQVFFTPGGGS